MPRVAGEDVLASDHQGVGMSYGPVLCDVGILEEVPWKNNHVAGNTEPYRSLAWRPRLLHGID